MKKNSKFVNEKTITKIIKENIKRLINEYHHSYDNGLYNDAINIGNELIKHRRKGWNGLQAVTYRTDTLKDNQITQIRIILTRNQQSSFQAWNGLVINRDIVDKASTDEKSLNVLYSTIYHELSNLLELNKSKNLSRVKQDIKTPSLLNLEKGEDKQIIKTLYLFQRREMNARCFETTMFLKQNSDKNISLKELYDNECTNINKMANFINYLKSCANNNIDEKNKSIIQDIFNAVYYNKERNTLTTEIMANKLFNFFNIRLEDFKKKIHKIFYDYKHNFNLN